MQPVRNHHQLVRSGTRLVASAAVVTAWLSVALVALVWHYHNAFVDHLECPLRSGEPGSLSVGGPSSGSWCSYAEGRSIGPEKSHPFTMATPTWSLVVSVLAVAAAATLGIWALRRLRRWARPAIARNDDDPVGVAASG